MATYEDAREKTRNNLINAFWDLYSQKDINKITIKEITDRAGYNRATFYIYFKNAQQVLDYVEEMIYHQMGQSCYGPPENLQEAEDQMRTFVVNLEKNRKFIGVLLSEQGDPKFAKAFREQFYQMVTRIVEEGKLETTIPLETALDFLIGGIVSCMQQWYQNPSDVSAHELICRVFRAAFFGVFRTPEKMNSVYDGMSVSCADIIN